MTLKTNSGSKSEPTTAIVVPRNRPRRLRSSEGVRAMVRENEVKPADLILPLFIVPDSRPRVQIGS
ncbi:MAG: porphobilinogen synthase, partial [Thermoanaerobaculia bacterium]